MCGKTITTLKRNCLGLLSEQIGKNITYSVSQKKAVIFGHSVDLEGANDERSESKIRGSTYKGVYIDELSQIPESFYLMALSRLSKAGAALIATTNPDSPNHYVKLGIIDNESIDKQVIKFLLDDNDFLDEEYKRNLIAEYQSMSILYYQRFVLGEFVRAEGLVFPEFAAEPSKHYITEADLFSRKNGGLSFAGIEVGFDIGGNGSAYALTCTAYGNDNRLYVLRAKKTQADAVKMEDVEKLVSGFCRSVESKYNVHISHVNSDHVDVIINTLNDRTPYYTGKTYKPPLEDRPFAISQLLAEKRLLFVDNECGDLIDEMCNLVFDDKAEKAIQLDDGSMQIDTWDSFIYSVSGNWDYLDLRGG